MLLTILQFLWKTERKENDLIFLEVKFKGGRKIFYRNPQEFPLRAGDRVIVQADRGYDLGKVAVPQVDDSIAHKEFFEVIRKPNKTDLDKLVENKKLEKIIFREVKKTMREFNPMMKLADVEYQFDRSKISFFFTSDRRIDFRDLVKELASRYKARIELRQIGVRDEAKRIGGCGVCGLELCCTTFLKGFEPISSQYAKEQSLTLNASKLSGSCGRLKCCLVYERDFYVEELKKYPEIDSIHKIEGVPVLIDKIDVFKNIIYVKNLLDNYWDNFTPEQWEELKPEFMLPPEEIETITRPNYAKLDAKFQPTRDEVAVLRKVYSERLGEVKNQENDSTNSSSGNGKTNQKVVSKFKAVEEENQFEKDAIVGTEPQKKNENRSAKKRSQKSRQQNNQQKPKSKNQNKPQKQQNNNTNASKTPANPIKNDSQKKPNEQKTKVTSSGIPIPEIRNTSQKPQNSEKAKVTSSGIPIPPVKNVSQKTKNDAKPKVTSSGIPIPPIAKFVREKQKKTAEKTNSQPNENPENKS
ncbi:MAG: hypothetical protein DWQ06_08995 [Calditrichaeota bacterium]|nr:MAG: hypothetical protein DWQ06_08995 [Calditrichota bacterium]